MFSQVSRKAIACLPLVLMLAGAAFAQNDKSARVAGSSNPIVTATATSDRVRIAAPAAVVQLRLEAYDDAGRKVFDTEQRGGNVLDWHLQSAEGERVADGRYLCVVTVKSLSGRITQRLAQVSVAAEQTSVVSVKSGELNPIQAQAVGPVDDSSGDDAGPSVVKPGESAPATIVAHNGGNGEITRTRGAFSFRLGDFFSGNDTEQMRLTEGGDLGIGTSQPKAKLEVAGTIRAERFLVAKPNRPASDIKAQAGDSESIQPLVAGTGTQDRIAKWTDNAGTLGDSSITETGGNVGIGTTTPGSKLVVSANSATLPPASGVARFADADGGQTAVFADAFANNAIFNVRRANGTAASPSALQANQLVGVIGASGYGASAYMGTRARVAFWASEMWTDIANGTYLTFNTTANGAATPGGTERVRIDNAGNVGIGTTLPASKLHVNGEFVLDAPGPTLHTGASAGEQNRYLHLINSPFFRSASGLKAGGILVAENYDYANPGKNNLIVKGNVGIGTTNPIFKLDVEVGGIGGAIYGQSSDLFGVQGESVGTGVGVIARSHSGNLVEGYSTATGFILRKFHIDINGTYTAGSDFAEALPANGDRAGYEPGDVLVVSTKAPGKVEKASQPYDPRVAGIYSTRPGMLGADKNGTSRVDKGDVPVAIVGIAPTKVSAMNGPIRVGDLLTTSSTPGYAMRCANRVKCVGAIVGKALEPLAGGQGVIKVLVMLR